MSDKMREEFEAWVMSNWTSQSLERFNPLHGVTDGEYTGFTVQHCWDAWKASRESLVIDLPRDVTNVTNKDFEEGRDAVIDAIEAAGLKVKP